MLFGYQLKITGLYIIPNGNVKILVPKFFVKKNMSFIMKARNFT